ncbi:MAG: hypothetical protein COB29_00890 [Sulfitobacter sp.]|nr:MAG: hypothetical protein COB29_00890 [Sulfitobacter sp.]
MRELRAEVVIPKGVVRRHPDNKLEGDRRELKQLSMPSLGFKSMKTAYTTIKKFKIMSVFKKG